MQTHSSSPQIPAAGFPPGYSLMAPAAAMIALGVYLLTIAPHLTWANGAIDGAELVVASSTLGVAHPPGYPTYIILGKLFSYIPIATIAFRYNLFSTVSISLAVGLVTLTIGTLYPRVRPMVALAAALLFAFSPLVWSQATVTEVYGLNLFMVAAFLFIWSRTGTSFTSGFFLGLALTSHLTSLFLLPAFLICVRRNFFRPAVGLVIGLMPLALLPLLASGDSPVVWGSPDSLAGWIWLVTGRLYGANLRPEFDAEHLERLLRAVLLGPAALLLAGKSTTAFPVPAAGARIDSRPTPKLLTLTLLLYILFSLFYMTPDAAVLLLPALLLASILISPALNKIGPASMLLPLALVLITFAERDLRQDRHANEAAFSLLESTPENALLLTPGDRTIFVILYFQHLEGMRKDLRVVDSNLFAFDWYRARIASQYPDLFVPEADDLGAFQRHNQTTRPFCLASVVELPAEFRLGEPAAMQVTGNHRYFNCIEVTH